MEHAETLDRLDDRLSRLARLEGGDPGFFVLAVHSFIEGHLRTLYTPACEEDGPPGQGTFLRLGVGGTCSDRAQGALEGGDTKDGRKDRDFVREADQRNSGWHRVRCKM